MSKINTVLILILCCGQLQAQEEEKSALEFPNLQGQKMITLSNMRSAFNNSQAYVNLELGYSSIFSTPGIVIGDSLINQLTNELVYTRLSFVYQQRIKDWISFYARMEYGARVGTGVEAVLTEGINTISSGEFGISFKLSEGEKHRLNGYLKLHNVEAELINVRRYITDVIEGNPYAAVKQKIPALNAGGGLALSTVLFPYLALHTDAHLAYGETLNRNEETYLYFLAGNFDLKTDDWLNIPLSIGFGGSVTNLVGIYSLEGTYTTTLNTRLNYTGSEDFSISIELYSGRTPVAQGSAIVDSFHVNVSGAQINCVFHF